MFVGIFGRGPSLKTRLLTPALGIAFSILLLWLPSAVFFIKDADSVTLLPDALFAVHVRLIDKMLEARIAALSESDPEKGRLQALVTVMKSELKIAEADNPYRTLGFNPDYLMHSDAFTNAIYRYTGNDARKFSAFCIACYKDAALHDPVAFGRKALVQFTQFLFPTRDAFYQRSGEFARFYRESAAVSDPRGDVQFRANESEMRRQYRVDLAAQTGSGFRLDAKRIPTKLGRAFALLALPLEILFLLSFVASLICAPLRDLRLAGFAALSLFSAPLGSAVTVCVVHSLDIYRYRHTYEGFLLFALVAMTVFTALVIARWARHALGASSEAREKGS